MVLEISQNSQESTFGRLSYLIKLQARPGGFFKCLKDKWRHVLLTIYYVIIQKTMSPRKSEEDVTIKFCSEISQEKICVGFSF